MTETDVNYGNGVNYRDIIRSPCDRAEFSDATPLAFVSLSEKVHAGPPFARMPWNASSFRNLHVSPFYRVSPTPFASR